MWEKDCHPLNDCYQKHFRDKETKIGEGVFSRLDSKEEKMIIELKWLNFTTSAIFIVNLFFLW